MGKALRALVAVLALVSGISGLYLVAYGDGMELRHPWDVARDHAEVSDAYVSANAQVELEPEIEPEGQPQTFGDPYGIDQLHHRSLDEGGRRAYDTLYQQVIDGQASFTMDLPDTGALEVALRALMADHPEVFWLSGSCTYRRLADGMVDVELKYNVSPEQIDRIQGMIDHEVSSFLETLPSDATTYDKVRTAYEWVIEETDYVQGSAQDQNIQSVFIGHESVCAGYAKAFQYLLRLMGIPCAYVRGRIESENIDHAWNLVSIDGTPTFVDVTWGDPTYLSADGRAVVDNICYDYLCFTTNEMERIDHRVTSPASLPICDSDRYDYYRLNGLLLESLDQSLVDDVFRRVFEAGESRASFKFTNDETLAEAIAAADDGSLLGGAFVELASQRYGAGSLQYRSAVNEALRVLTIFW